jgi:diguanylate cyclase (GGDEF)-like protein
MTESALDSDPTAFERSVLEAAVRLARTVAGTTSADVNLVAGGCVHDGHATHVSVPVQGRDGTPVGILCAYDHAPRPVSAEQTDRLRDVATQVAVVAELRRAAAALARVAGRDALTGLADRRSIEKALTAAIARAERGLGTPSVVVVDLDGFAEVNDRFGHAAGDAVLRAVAERLVRTARVVDTVGRVGGDEFAVVLESTGGPGAVAALARLRRGLEDGWGDEAGGLAPVRASLGLSTYRPGDSVPSLLARADAEMFADKNRALATS